MAVKKDFEELIEKKKDYGSRLEERKDLLEEKGDEMSLERRREIIEKIHDLSKKVWETNNAMMDTVVDICSERSSPSDVDEFLTCVSGKAEKKIH